MNMTKWIAICLLAVALAPVGCSKKDSGTTNQPPAVSVDVPKLRDAFTSASPDLQKMVGLAIRAIASHREAQALPILDQLANAPGLTDAQKQVVTEVTAQVKQMASRAAAAPTQ